MKDIDLIIQQLENRIKVLENNSRIMERVLGKLTDSMDHIIKILSKLVR